MRNKVIIILIIIFSLLMGNVYAEDIDIAIEKQTLSVNEKTIDIYSYNINNESYFMLRDIAYILNNTNKQINILWDSEKNAIKILNNVEYTSTDSHLHNIEKSKPTYIIPSPTDIYLDEDKIDITSYKIDDSNYIRLQDIMLLLDICMLYDENNKLVGIDTSLTYNKDNHVFLPSSNVKTLLYHHFTEDIPSQDQFYISVSKDKFEADIKTLLEEGYLPLSLENYYLNMYNKNKKYFIITFDDGYLSNYEIAYPIIKKYNVYADIFINTDNIYMDHHFKLDQAKEMEDSGLIKVYSHYPIHIDVRNVEATEYTNMLHKSIETLETVLDKKNFYFFAYPYGYYNEEKYHLTQEAGFKLQAIQSINYKGNDLVVRYNVTHTTNVLKLISNIAY